MWLNSFPVKGGISQTFSPRELITRRKLDAKLHCKTVFGSYCEVHDEPTLSNTMQRRTHPAISLGPTGNLQGSYKFLCLTTDQLLVRRRFTPMPGIPTTVINAVLKFADREHKPTGVAFRNRKNELFNFTNNEIGDILMPCTVYVAPYPDIENKLPGPMTVTPVTADPEPAPPDRDEQAIQAANNAGLDINIIADPGMPMQHHYNAIPILHDAVVSDDNTNSASETDATASDDESHAPPPTQTTPPQIRAKTTTPMTPMTTIPILLHSPRAQAFTRPPQRLSPLCPDFCRIHTASSRRRHVSHRLCPHHGPISQQSRHPHCQT